METTKKAPETAPHSELETLIQRAQSGDTTTLPAIREVLDQTPAFWQNARHLASEIERRWLQVLAGDDLISQEIWERQVAALKAELSGPTPTPLDHLLVERIVVCWLQMQDAEGRAARYRSQYGYVPDSYETRIARTQKRFLEAAKSFAQVQKSLRPKTAVVNIAGTQQVNIT